MSKKTHSIYRIVTAATIVASAAALTLTSCSPAGKDDGSDPDGRVLNGTLFDKALHESLPEKIQDSGRIQIASVLTDELFNSKKNGETVGVIPDLAHDVGEILGVEITFVDTPFPGMIPAVQSNRVDAIWSTMNDTKEREEQLDFVDWIRTSATLMVSESNPLHITSMNDVCGTRVATLKTAASFVKTLEQQSEQCVVSQKAPIDLKLYDDFPSGQTQLRAGQIDAFFGPAEKLHYISSLRKGEFKVLDDEYLGGVYGIGVSKEKPELSKAILAALKKVHESGRYEQVLEERHIGTLGLTQDEFQINGAGAFD